MGAYFVTAFAAALVLATVAYVFVEKPFIPVERGNPVLQGGEDVKLKGHLKAQAARQTAI